MSEKITNKQISDKKIAKAIGAFAEDISYEEVSELQELKKTGEILKFFDVEKALEIPHDALEKLSVEQQEMIGRAIQEELKAIQKEKAESKETADELRKKKEELEKKNYFLRDIDNFLSQLSSIKTDEEKLKKLQSYRDLLSQKIDAEALTDEEKKELSKRGIRIEEEIRKIEMEIARKKDSVDEKNIKDIFPDKKTEKSELYVEKDFFAEEIEKIESKSFGRRFSQLVKRNKVFKKLVFSAGYLSNKAKDNFEKFKGTKLAEKMDDFSKTKFAHGTAAVSAGTWKGMKWFYGLYRGMMHSDNKWRKLGKRILFSAVIGAVTGGGSIALTAISGLSGIGAGYAYEKLTKKKLQKNMRNFDQKAFSKRRESAKIYAENLAENRELLHDLRRKKRENILNDEDAILLEKLEKERSEKIQKIKTTMEYIKSERDRLIKELEKKNQITATRVTMIVSALTGLGLHYGPGVLNKVFDTDFSDRFGLAGNEKIHKTISDYFHKSPQPSHEWTVGGGNTHKTLDNNIKSGDNIHHQETGSTETGSATQETTTPGHTTGTTEPGTPAHEATGPIKLSPEEANERMSHITEDAVIKKGQGYSYAIRNILNKRPDLRAHFGITNDKLSIDQIKEVTKKLGYLKENGDGVGVFDGKHVAIDIEINGDGKAVVHEFVGGHMENGHYVGGHYVESNPEGAGFEGDKIESVKNVGVKRAYEYKMNGNTHHGHAEHTGHAQHRETQTGEHHNQGAGQNEHASSAHHENHGITTSHETHTTEHEEGTLHHESYHTKIPFINGDPREIGEKISGHMYDVKLDHGVVAHVQYNDAETNITSVIYQNFDGQDYNMMIDSNGDGIIDRFVEKNSQLDFETLKDMSTEEIIKNPAITQIKGFNGVTYTRLIDFPHIGGKEAVIDVNGGQLNQYFDQKHINALKHEAFEKMNMEKYFDKEPGHHAVTSSHHMETASADLDHNGGEDIQQEDAQDIYVEETQEPSEIVDGGRVDVFRDEHGNTRFIIDKEHTFSGHNHPGAFRPRHERMIQRGDFRKVFEAKAQDNGPFEGMHVIQLKNGDYILEMDGESKKDALSYTKQFIEDMGIHTKDSEVASVINGSEKFARTYTRITRDQAEYIFKQMKGFQGALKELSENGSMESIGNHKEFVDNMDTVSTNDTMQSVSESSIKTETVGNGDTPNLKTMSFHELTPEEIHKLDLDKNIETDGIYESETVVHQDGGKEFHFSEEKVNHPETGDNETINEKVHVNNDEPTAKSTENIDQEHTARETDSNEKEKITVQHGREDVAVHGPKYSQEELNHLFEGNDIVRNDIREWLHFIKTSDLENHKLIAEYESRLAELSKHAGEYDQESYMQEMNKIRNEYTKLFGEDIEKNDIFVGSETQLRDDLKSGRINFKQFQEKLHELKEQSIIADKKAQLEFLKKTSDVSVDEVKKVFEDLNSRMDVKNLSDLTAFDMNLDTLREVLEKNPSAIIDYINSMPADVLQEKLDNFDITSRTFVSMGEEGMKSIGNHQEEAILTYLKLKQLLNQ